MAKDLEKRKIWESKLQNCEESGLSEIQWCKQNGEKYHCFKYYKQELRLKKEPLFKELKGTQRQNIKIQIGSMTISFPFGSNSQELKNQLKVIKELICSE